jgi:CheY-like chemotaxis protein
MTPREYPSVPPGLRRVTVVNDSPEFLDMMGDWLASERYHATLIDGDDVNSIEPIRASGPELLIVDLRLRGSQISGWDILTAIRADTELGNLPVIICTGDSFEVRERAEDVAAMPGVEILLKPFAIDDLEAMVRRLLG